MSSKTQSPATISQEHNGIGDIIARDKIINEYRELAPKEIRKTIDLILSDYRERNTDKAKVRLETIKSTSALSSDSETILDMVSIHLNLFEEAEKTKVHSSLISFLKNSTDPLSCDLCLATLIRLDAENSRIEDARERYQKTNQKDTYTKEAFYEFAANNNELEKVYKNKRLDLGESELNGLIRGSFRIDNLKLALTIAIRLNDVFPSFNSKVLLLIAKANLLFDITLQGTHFWTITSISKVEVMIVIEEVNSLITESAGKDSRLFNIAAHCLQYTFGDDKNLSNLCWKYVDEIEKTHPEIAAKLYNINTKDTSKIENTHHLKYLKAQHDERYRSQLLNEIYSSKNVSITDFIFLKDFSARNKIRQWAQSGGQVSCQEGLETDFSNIEISLILLSGKNNNDQIEKIRVQIEKFINGYHDKLKTLEPVILLKLSDDLLKYPELSPVVCDLIKPMLPVSDCWLSPIVKCYIEALLASQQMATLTTILSEISEDERGSFVWQVQARIHEQKGDYEKAIESTEKALYIDPYVLNSWCFLVQQHFLLKVSDELFRTILDRVPDSVLSKKTDQAASLIFEMATAGDFPRAEKIILSWFSDDPAACAVTLSNFHFNLSMKKGQGLNPQAENVGNCTIGVRFKKDNQVFTKLLITNENIKHQSLLDINSPLGEQLLKMDLNEVKTFGLQDIELLQRLPPYVAALQISVELRQVQNDESDCFYSFNLPKKPDKIVDFFKQKLCKEKESDIVENTDIPFIFKGHFLHPNEPIKGALKQFLTKKTNKSLLPNFGEDSFSEVVLDIYAVMYLAITGLAFGIEDNSIRFVITKETKYVIEQWLQEIKNENHSSIGIHDNGGLWLQSAEDIKKSTQHLQETLFYISWLLTNHRFKKNRLYGRCKLLIIDSEFALPRIAD